MLQKLAHQIERRPLVPPGLDENVENFTLGVHGTLKIDQATTDFQIDLIEMPVGMWLRSAFVKIGRDVGSKMVHPAAYRLIGHYNSPLLVVRFNQFERIW